MKANRSSTTNQEAALHPETTRSASGHADHVRRFFTVAFLEQIPRAALESFFDRFAADCADKKLTLLCSGSDADYYFHLRCLLAGTAPLPAGLTEALRTIHQMASADAHHRLTALLAGDDPAERKRLAICTPAEVAMHAWMTAPDALAQAGTEARLLRLTLFTYYGAARQVAAPERLDCPPAGILERIQADLDAWFASHYRGEETVRLHVHNMDDEFWFLIRHGDIFSRKAAVERRATEILRFRPAKDDVVVYSPERNELRIHAGTEGEKVLYRQTFGHRLFGDPEYFCEHNACTLEPLRRDGPAALYVGDIPGISRILLAEVELKYSNAWHDTTIHKFGHATAFNRWPGIPSGGELMRAVFDISFSGSPRSRKVEICPPNQLRLGRHCDIHLVQRWLSKRGFRIASRPKTFCAVNT